MAGLSLDLIALQLFAGLALGAIYVLFAIGLSLIFGMLTVVNFAHGAFYMVGAYAGVYILMLGGNFWICLIAVPLAVGLFGLLVERVLIRPLYGRGIDYPLLLTFGLSYVMVEPGPDRVRQDGISVRHPRDPARRGQYRRRLFSALSPVRDWRHRRRVAGAVAVS